MNRYTTIRRAIDRCCYPETPLVCGPQRLKAHISKLKLKYRLWNTSNIEQSRLSISQTISPEPNHVLVVVYPSKDWHYNLVSFNEQFCIAECVAKYIKENVPIITISQNAIEEAPIDSFRTTPTSLQEAVWQFGIMGCAKVTFVKDEKTQLQFNCKEWQIDTGRPEDSNPAQLPAGEIFAVTERCVSGKIRIELPTSKDKAAIVDLTLHEGIVIKIEDMVGRILYGHLLGKQIEEIGIGLNPQIQPGCQEWSEKAAFTVHMGFGTSEGLSLIGPGTHSDFLILCGYPQISGERREVIIPLL